MNDNDRNIVYLNMITSHDIPADRILTRALGELECVVIAGYGKDGTEYFASSLADGGDALWLLERCKKKLLEIVDD